MAGKTLEGRRGRPRDQHDVVMGYAYDQWSLVLWQGRNDGVSIRRRCHDTSRQASAVWAIGFVASHGRNDGANIRRRCHDIIRQVSAVWAIRFVASHGRNDGANIRWRYHDTSRQASAVWAIGQAILTPLHSSFFLPHICQRPICTGFARQQHQWNAAAWMGCAADQRQTTDAFGLIGGTQKGRS